MIKIKNCALIFFLIFSTSGCWLFAKSKPVQPITVLEKAVEKEPLNIPMPDPIKLLPFEWIVITPENEDEVWKNLQNNKMDAVLFGITPKDYENMSKNLETLKGFYLKQRSIIKSYKQYWEPPIKDEAEK